MLISRLHTRSSQPLFCVPLRGRQDAIDARRVAVASDAGGRVTRAPGDCAIGDESMRRAAHVRSDDLHARAGWWAERAALDKRLTAGSLGKHQEQDRSRCVVSLVDIVLVDGGRVSLDNSKSTNDTGG